MSEKKIDEDIGREESDTNIVDKIAGTIEMVSYTEKLKLKNCKK